MDWGYIIAIVITGLVVVFVALIGLIFCIWFVSKILSAISNKKNNQAKKTETSSVEKPKPAPAVKQAVVKEAATVEEGIPGGVIAAISAAVAMMMGGQSVSIKSIKRTASPKSARSAWSNAGVIENTRPF